MTQLDPIRPKDRSFTSPWDRLKYAAYACAPIGGSLILLVAVAQVAFPERISIAMLFSPIFTVGLFAFCWFVAPRLSRWISL